MSYRSALLLLTLTSSVAAMASGVDDCQRVVLIDASEELGVAFEHDRGASGLKHLPETMGAGLAWLDFDGDGWQDLYLVQSGPFPSPVLPRRHGRLLRNLQGTGL